MFRNSPVCFSSRVCGGHMRFITGTNKYGYGAVHTRHINGSRGHYKRFSRNHGLRFGTPSYSNQTTGSLGVKMGYGGLFGARRAIGGERAKTIANADALEDKLFGNPTITNGFKGQLHLHPSLDLVTHEAPMHITLLVALPKFPVEKFIAAAALKRQQQLRHHRQNQNQNSSSDDNATTNVDGRSLPRMWRNTIPSLREVMGKHLIASEKTARKNNTNTNTNSSSNVVVLATKRTSVAIQILSKSNNKGGSKTQKGKEVEGAAVVLTVIENENGEGTNSTKKTFFSLPKTTTGSENEKKVANNNHSISVDRSIVIDNAIKFAMKALIDAHGKFSEPKVVTAANNKKTENSLNMSKTPSLSSSTPIQMPTTLLTRRRSNIFDADDAKSKQQSQQQQEPNPPVISAPLPVATARKDGSGNISSSSPSSIVSHSSSSSSSSSVLGRGIVSLLAAIRDGTSINAIIADGSASDDQKKRRGGGEASSYNSSATAAVPPLIISTCMRVDPTWSYALGDVIKNDHRNGNGKKKRRQQEAKQDNKKKEEEGGEVEEGEDKAIVSRAIAEQRAVKEVIRKSFVEAAKRLGVSTSKAHSNRSHNNNSEQKKKVGGNAEGVGGVGEKASPATTETKNTATDAFTISNRDFSVVRSASTTASSVQSHGAKRTGFVTMTTSLPIATLCQWHYYNHDKRTPLKSQQVILPTMKKKKGNNNNDRTSTHDDDDDDFSGIAPRGSIMHAATGTHGYGSMPSLAYSPSLPSSSSPASSARSGMVMRRRVLFANENNNQQGEEEEDKSEFIGRPIECNWQTPIYQPTPIFTQALMHDRATTKQNGNNPSSSSSLSVPPMHVVMVVRCFAPRRNFHHNAAAAASNNYDFDKQSKEKEEGFASSSSTTTRLGQQKEEDDQNIVANNASSPALRAVEKSEWELDELLDTSSAASAGMMTNNSKNISSRGRSVGGEYRLPSPASSASSPSSLSSPHRSFSFGDVLVGSPMVDKLMGLNLEQRVKIGKRLGQSEGESGKASEKKMDKMEEIAGTTPAATSNNSKKNTTAGNAEVSEKAARLINRRRGGGGNDFSSSSLLKRSKKHSNANGISSYTASAASPANCPLVAYINDEVANSVTAYLKQKLNARPISEDVFGALKSLRVWHDSVARSGTAANRNSGDVMRHAALQHKKKMSKEMRMMRRAYLEAYIQQSKQQQQEHEQQQLQQQQEVSVSVMPGGKKEAAEE